VPLANGAEHVAPQLIPAGALVTVPVPVPAFATVKVKFVCANVAVTLVAAVTVTTQVPVPEHGAPQPVKVDPVAGAAVKVTCVPLAKLAEHVAPQLIPAGALVTVPVPCPFLFTVRVRLGVGANVADTDVAAVSVTTQVPVPEHGAPQPEKVDPVAGVAVKVTCVPLAKFAEHVAPQLIPAGALVTVPVPVPALTTVKAIFVVLSAKLAVTLIAWEATSTQVPVPEHGASQPVKVEPVAATAVRVTCVPLSKLAVHVAPQLIPAGALVTVPVPVPALVTVIGKVSMAKVAVTVCAPFIVTVHVGGLVCGLVGTQLVLIVENVESAPAVMVSSTWVPGAYCAEQVAGHRIPGGWLER
jgi:hypothetical protein